MLKAATLGALLGLGIGFFMMGFHVGENTGRNGVWSDFREDKDKCEEKLPRDQYCVIEWVTKK